MSHEDGIDMAVRIADAIVGGVEKAWNDHLEVMRAARAAQVDMVVIGNGGVAPDVIQRALLTLFPLTEKRAGEVIDILVESGRIVRRDGLLFSRRVRTDGG